MSDTTVRLTQVTESERDRLTDIRCRPGHRRLTRPANGTPTTSCIVGHYSGRFDVISEGLASADEYGESAKKVSGASAPARAPGAQELLAAARLRGGREG